MHLLERDRAILTYVARFGQLTTAHLDALLFADLKSRKPCQRVLRRLFELDLLHRVNQKLPGGPGGGSQRFAYAIGPAAWRLFYPGKYRPARVLSLHSLAIADVFVATRQAEQDGQLKVLDYATEPDSWMDGAGADLRPDLFVDLGLIATARRRVMWLEVDLATERQKQIIEKLDRYAHAYKHSDQLHLDAFPEIVFLAPDAERVRELEKVIARFMRTARDVHADLFRVGLIADFPAMLLRA